MEEREEVGSKQQPDQNNFNLCWVAQAEMVSVCQIGPQSQQQGSFLGQSAKAVAAFR
jgi:hypothetical protein